MTTTTTAVPAAAFPPGPKGYPLVGNLPGYARDPLGFVTRCFGRYGDVVDLNILPSVREYGLNRPDLIERVMVGSNRGFVKGRFERWMLGFLGNGLLISEGSLWRRQRRLMQPAFHRRRVEAYGKTMVAYAERMLGGWRDGEERDAHEDMTRLTLEIVAKTLFDRDVGGGEAGEVEGALGTVMGHFSEQGGVLLTQLLPGFVPTPGRARFRRAVERLDGIIYGIIEERRREGDRDAGDLLSMLLSARDEETGEGMSDKTRRSPSSSPATRPPPSPSHGRGGCSATTPRPRASSSRSCGRSSAVGRRRSGTWAPYATPTRRSRSPCASTRRSGSSAGRRWRTPRSGATGCRPGPSSP